MESYNVAKDAEIILSAYCTSELLSPVVSSLESLVSTYYSVSRGPLLSAFGNIFPPLVLQSLTPFSSQGGSQSISDSALVEYVKSLINILKTAKVLRISLAFEPSVEFLHVLHTRVVSMTGVPTVINIALDKKIIGGCLLSYDGYYKDLSLTSYIDKYFLTNKQYVQKLL